MKIGLIGGLTRSEAFFRKMAGEKGHELDFHTGELSRRSIEGMRSLVQRSDFVIILTGINSHQAVWLAKQTAREFMRPSVIMFKCGPDSFCELLDLLGGPGRWSGKETALMGKDDVRHVRLRFSTHPVISHDSTSSAGAPSKRRASAR